MISSPATLPTILALTSTVMVDLSTAASLEMSSATLTADLTVRQLLIRLPPMVETEGETTDEGDPFAAFNASRREPLERGSVSTRRREYTGEIAAEPSRGRDEGEVGLPAELAELIAAAKSDSQELSSTAAEAGARYYPTYSQGESCSSKSSSSFKIWEESYASLEDCCEAAFSWDYDACIGF